MQHILIDSATGKLLVDGERVVVSALGWPKLVYVQCDEARDTIEQISEQVQAMGPTFPDADAFIIGEGVESQVKGIRITAVQYCRIIR